MSRAPRYMKLPLLFEFSALYCYYRLLYLVNFNLVLFISWRFANNEAFIMCSQACLTFYFLLAVCAFTAKLCLQKGPHVLLGLLSVCASVAIIPLAPQTISGTSEQGRSIHADTLFTLHAAPGEFRRFYWPILRQDLRGVS